MYHGIRGLVKELTENYATELGEWPEIIATGGDAKALFEGWELIHAIAPDLTLNELDDLVGGGLNTIAEDNSFGTVGP